jgi:hypothetical protein
MFIFENYEITIDKKDDSVYVQLLDKQFYKLYSKNYYDIDVLDFNMTLDMFFKVLNTVFNALVDNNKENATIEIVPSSENIKFKIHHKYYIDFKFELCLVSNKDYILGPKEMCIKKLEKNIDKQKKDFDMLKKDFDVLNELYQVNKTFIDDHMSLVVSEPHIYNPNQYDSKGNPLQFEYEHNLKISTKKIIFRNYENNKVLKTIDNSITTLNIDTGTGTKMTNSLTMINADTLEISGINYNFGYKFLPLSLKTLVLHGSTPVTFLKETELPNLETIEIRSSGIINIYESIAHLKTIKNIVIAGSTAFLENGLLLTHGYNVILE